MKLLLLGDVMLGRLVNDALQHEAPAYPWGDTLPLLREADWRACNLECVISDHGIPWARTPKAFHFRADARQVEVLKAAHIDAVSLANNHTLDFNHRGMIEMLRVLDTAGIAHAGAGLDREQAAAPTIDKVCGVRIGMISFTDNMPEWAAEPGRPGIFFAPVDERDGRTERLLDLVRETRVRVDLLIVAAHWGGNWGRTPPTSHVILGHELVQAGADVVFGHSPHVCRGIEVFEGGLILYSAGDFVDDYAVDQVEHNDHSWIFELHVEDGKVQALHLHPTVIRQFQARLASQDEAATMRSDMQHRCAPFGMDCAWADPGRNHLVVDVHHHAAPHLAS